MQQVVTVAPGTGIGFRQIQHETRVKEQALQQPTDEALLYTLDLERGKSVSSNEVERHFLDSVHKVNVECSVEGAKDEQDNPIIGKLICYGRKSFEDDLHH